MIPDLFHRVTVSGLVAGDTWRIVIPIAGFVTADGMTALAHLRRTVADTTVVLAFSSAAGTILFEAGQITLLASAAATAAVPPGIYVWDLRLTQGDETDTPMGGQMIVRARVTR